MKNQKLSHKKYNEDFHIITGLGEGGAELTL